EFGHPYTIFDYNILVTNFGKTQPTPIVTPTTFPTPIVTDPPITRNVMVIDFNPIIESQGNKRLREIEHWNDPETLESQYIKDMQTVSGGYLNYHIVTRLSNIDAYPTKNNGYVFTDEEYFSSLP
ncbi:MAG: hypothetical protein NTY06_02405, partial [Candidatus Gottesmanbacteria bacterium]|nr:hypothetical protein [Candidatus Gottesmanbacteria bacterium]